MISTVAEFEQEVAWERTVLALAIPLMPLAASGADLDIRRNIVSTTQTAPIGGNDAGELKNKLLPLLFGSSWKILDMSLELALAMSKIAPRNGTRWLISEKSQHALTHAGTLPGFSSNDLWQAYGSLYAETQETRHALVHRRVRVNSNTGELTGFDNNGNALKSITYDEQMAFCRFAQRLGQAIIEGSVRPRVESDMRSQIAVLQGHHGVNVQATSASRPPVRVIDSFPSNGQLDIPTLMNRACTTFPGVTYVDILLHLVDGRTLLGELDSAPYAVVSVDINALPSWLQFV